MERYGFLTFRAHESETQVFEDFNTILLPILHKMSPFTYHIEEDETPARHIHAFFTLPSTMKPEKQKIQQKIETNLMKKIKQRCDGKQLQTVWSHALKIDLVGNTEEDKLLTLGYTIKDNVTRRQCIGIDTSLCRQAIDFYMVHHRNKQTTAEEQFTYATPKNIHSKILSFMKDKNYDGVPSTILYEMRQNYVSFIQMSTRQRKEALIDIKIAKKIETESETEYIQQLDNDENIEENNRTGYINYLQNLLAAEGISYCTENSNWFTQKKQKVKFDIGAASK